MISAQDSLNALVAASATFVGDVDYVASCGWRMEVSVRRTHLELSRWAATIVST